MRVWVAKDNDRVGCDVYAGRITAFQMDVKVRVFVLRSIMLHL
jgi:hypothetical protein